MKRKKVVIGIVVLVIMVLGSVISWSLLKKGEKKPHITITNEYDTPDANFLAASSYKQVYNQLLLGRVGEFFHYPSSGVTADKATGADGETNGKDDAVAEVNEQTDDFGKTNIQVDGVEEGDIVKNDGNYLYCINGDEVCIINMQGERMLVESVIDGYENLREIYVEGDRIILLSQIGQYGYLPEYDLGISKKVDGNRVYAEPQVSIDVYDIGNRKKPKLISKKKMDGWFKTARLSEGYLYVMASKDMYGIRYEIDKPSSYIPKVDNETMSYQDVIIPDKGISQGYMVIASLSLEKPNKFADKKAVFSNGYIFYVSPTNLYIADTLYNDKGSNSIITKINYNKGKLSVKTQGRIKGYLKNNFSIDEYEGYLRVVTTVENYDDYEFTTYNNLYVLDKSLKEAGKIEKLAKDEIIYSARFMGDVGYFVTFRQVDPLFSVDLSNPKKPKIIGKLKIPGFSTYLHFYGDNLLFGIGKEADENTGATLGLKLSMFDISDPSNVKEVHKLYLGDYTESEALDQYKEILVNDNKNIIGFSYSGYDINGMRQFYGVYHYDETVGFVQEYTFKQKTNIYNALRGTYIGEVVYILSLKQDPYYSDGEGGFINAYDRKEYQNLQSLSLN